LVERAIAIRPMASPDEKRKARERFWEVKDAILDTAVPFHRLSRGEVQYRSEVPLGERRKIAGYMRSLNPSKKVKASLFHRLEEIVVGLNGHKDAAVIHTYGVSRRDLMRVYNAAKDGLEKEAELGGKRETKPRPKERRYAPIKAPDHPERLEEERRGLEQRFVRVYSQERGLPEDQVTRAAQKTLKEQLQIFINFDETIEPAYEEAVQPKEEKTQLNPNLYRRVDELELSVRSANCLANANINFIGELVQKSEQEMLKTKNFGRKSLNEIKEILTEMNLTLGMKIEGYDVKDAGSFRPKDVE